MPGADSRIADGMTLTAGTSSWTAQLTGISHSGISRNSVDVSHLDLSAPSAGKFGNMLFKPSDNSDPGELSIEGHYDPDDIPPIDAVAETWTVIFDLETGDSVTSKLAASGFMTNFEWTGSLGDRVSFTATVKLSGNITRTSAS